MAGYSNTNMHLDIYSRQKGNKCTQKTQKVEAGFETKEIKSGWEKLPGFPDGKRIGTERIWAISGQS